MDAGAGMTDKEYRKSYEAALDLDDAITFIVVLVAVLGVVLFCILAQ